jgi:hypothetical protein
MDGRLKMVQSQVVPGTGVGDSVTVTWSETREATGLFI